MFPLDQTPRDGIELVAESVSFAYRSGQPVIDDWSAHFRPGQMVALTGPSGSGKSTTLFLLGLMLSLQSGSVWVGSQNTSALDDRARSGLRARSFGFVFQDAALDLNRTVLDNVTEVSVYRGEPREQWAPAAEQLVRSLGVEVPSDRKPGEISGGQAQRIALARALVGSPPVILADEPTGNLDRESATLVIDTLLSYARTGRVVVIVTHSDDVISASDRVIEL